MSWLTDLFERVSPSQSPPPEITERAGGFMLVGGTTRAGRAVSTETAQSVATFYRGANIISDDIAKMPLQTFRRVGSTIERVAPDPVRRNLPYLMEISPNEFGWTPFLFKKMLIRWLIFWGNAYVWSPPVFPAQKFLLPADQTRAVLDRDGRIWYEVHARDGKTRYLPDVEVLHVMINPDDSGFSGRSVLTYARENIGRQLAAYDTESGLLKRGMTPSMILKMAGSLDKAGRDKVRHAYQEAIGGADNAGGVAVFDNKVLEYQQVDMKLVDMQFLESIRATDLDIANFLGMPLHMLNMGKEAYNSNEQKYLEYLSTTLDAYLVQIEQAARLRWLPRTAQADTYLKFNRNALLRMDAKTRAEYQEIRIRSATMSPNEARRYEDESPYPGGDRFYITKNYGPIPEDGATDEKQTPENRRRQR